MSTERATSSAAGLVYRFNGAYEGICSERVDLMGR